MQPKLITFCALLLSFISPESGAQAPDNGAALTRDTAVRKSPDRGRRLRIGLDSGMILVEVTSRAASLTLIAPCGTFVDAYGNDSTLARWADEAGVLPPPVRDSTFPDKLRYPALRLGGANGGPYDNTTFKLIRLDTAMSSSFLLTSTNTAWDCGVRLDPEQAVAFFGALRGDADTGAIPFELPYDRANEAGRPHISGAWVGSDGLDREAELKGTPRGSYYPPEFVGSGITEKVSLQFIVDSTGKVRPSSIRLIGPARPAFAKSAIRTLLAAEYRPAERRGRPVPVFVSQEVRFDP
jgi:hypothetical protein